LAVDDRSSDKSTEAGTGTKLIEKQQPAKQPVQTEKERKEQEKKKVVERELARGNPKIDNNVIRGYN